MANVVRHRFASAKSDGLDPTQIQPSHWNDGHAFTGGTAGDVLTRDTTDPTFGATWAPVPPVASVVPYNAEWLAAGTPVPVGDGTKTSVYAHIGAKLVWVYVHISFGTGTPGLPGQWSITLPFPPADGVTTIAGIAYNGSVFQLVTHSIGVAQEALLMSPGSPMIAVTNNVPFIWSPNTHFAINGIYHRA